MMALPDYDKLDRPDASGLPLAWHLWGGDDQVGTLNNITPETVSAAARLVRRGKRFPLDLPIHVPLGMLGPGAHWIRGAAQQTLYKKTYAGLVIRDDKIDNLFLQSSTQWDGLSHVGDPHHGFPAPATASRTSPASALPGARCLPTSPAISRPKAGSGMRSAAWWRAPTTFAPASRARR